VENLTIFAGTDPMGLPRAEVEKILGQLRSQGQKATSQLVVEKYFDKSPQ
jgi:hypothetical protein